MDADLKYEAALLQDKKFWVERKQGGARPLRKMAWKALSDEAVFETVRKMMGFDTLGEARDLVGTELRKRLTESGNG